MGLPFGPNVTLQFLEEFIQATGGKLHSPYDKGKVREVNVVIINQDQYSSYYLFI